MTTKASLTPRQSDKIVRIYKDDPRNNKQFLQEHPNYIILNKTKPRSQKKSGHHPVQKHHHQVKSKKHKSPGVKPITHPGPNDTAVNGLYDPDDDELEELDSGIDLEGDDPQDHDDSDLYSQYLFHEAADEMNSPTSDHLTEHPPVATADYLGHATPYVPGVPTVTSIRIDPSSFIPQRDAADGSITMKASAYFDEFDDINDYDVIVTHVDINPNVKIPTGQDSYPPTVFAYNSAYIYENVGASLTLSGYSADSIYANVGASLTLSGYSADSIYANVSASPITWVTSLGSVSSSSWVRNSVNAVSSGTATMIDGRSGWGADMFYTAASYTWNGLAIKIPATIQGSADWLDIGIIDPADSSLISNAQGSGATPFNGATSFYGIRTDLWNSQYTSMQAGNAISNTAAAAAITTSSITNFIVQFTDIGSGQMTVTLSRNDQPGTYSFTIGAPSYSSGYIAIAARDGGSAGVWSVYDTMQVNV